ncbi:MAG: tetratricopeptide repeat protein [Candidatus Binatia bacterium]
MSERIHDLLELLTEEPEDAMLRLMLGKEYLAADDAAGALPHLEQAVALDPQYSAAYRELGLVLEKLGRTAEADEVYARGIAIADAAGDLQTAKEMTVFLQRLRARD